MNQRRSVCDQLGTDRDSKLPPCVDKRANRQHNIHIIPFDRCFILVVELHREWNNCQNEAAASPSERVANDDRNQTVRRSSGENRCSMERDRPSLSSVNARLSPRQRPVGRRVLQKKLSSPESTDHFFASLDQDARQRQCNTNSLTDPDDGGRPKLTAPHTEGRRTRLAPKHAPPRALRTPESPASAPWRLTAGRSRRNRRGGFPSAWPQAADQSGSSPCTRRCHPDGIWVQSARGWVRVR